MKNRVGVWLACLVLVGGILGISMTYLRSDAMAKVPTVSNEKIAHYLGMLVSEKNQLAEEEMQTLIMDREHPLRWMKADKEYFNLQMPDTVITTYPYSYVSIFHGTAITCGQLRFGLANEALLNFISSRRAQVALVKGDVHLEDEEFMELFALVCSQNSRLN